MKFQPKKWLPGLGYSFALSAIAWVVAPWIPGVNAVLMGLILGMLVGNVFKPTELLSPGISEASSTVLELAIILLAFGAGFDKLSSLGWSTVGTIAVTVLVMLILTSILSRYMNCPRSTGLLVGFGTTICGSSAIAAVSPAVVEEKQDIGIALAVVNLLGGVFMILMPLGLMQFLELEEHAGLMIGATLHSVGNVAGAGYTIGEAAGLEAVAVKMIRVALLAPAVILFSLINGKRSGSSFWSQFRLPYYLWLFFGVSLLVTWVPMPELVLSGAGFGADFLLTTAMVAIGLNTGFGRLYRSGRRAVGFGAVLFGFQVGVVLLLVELFL